MDVDKNPHRDSPKAQLINNQQFHQELMRFGHARMVPKTPQQDSDWQATLQHNLLMTGREIRFFEQERQKIMHLANEAPSDTLGFLAWFESLRDTGPGQNDALFPWLADHVDESQMRWFIQQEVAGEAGFDDLVALTQLRMPVQAKLEMARNYWDEMGRGSEQGMHGPMLDATVRELNISDNTPDNAVWEALALGNMLLAAAFNRRYAYHSVGALGAVELTAPSRSVWVAKALQKLNISKSGSLYFKIHSTVDIRHSKDWNREVIASLVDGNPDVAQAIAEGALMRLNAGARCFDRYRREFGIISPETYIHGPSHELIEDNK
ncbi:MAG: iron-containing redox enzyme family protein [Pseudomonadales bacterium]|nr:iron-containing redox enzyme family protein [Pseudomonadales bacterium]